MVVKTSKICVRGGGRFFYPMLADAKSGLAEPQGLDVKLDLSFLSEHQNKNFKPKSTFCFSSFFFIACFSIRVAGAAARD